MAAGTNGAAGPGPRGPDTPQTTKEGKLHRILVRTTIADLQKQLSCALLSVSV